jgi:thymidylate kinase
MYIVFEGLDGVGKSFLLERFIKENKGYLGILDYELNGAGKKIFDSLSKFKTDNPVAETLCFFVVDLIDIDKKVKPNLNEGKIIIQDRGVDTSCLYGAISLHLKNKKNLIENYEKLYEIRKKLGLLPDLVICFTDNFNKCLKRAEERNKREFTKEEKEFLKLVDFGFRELIKNYPSRINEINREGKSEEEVLKEIKLIIERFS